MAKWAKWLLVAVPVILALTVSVKWLILALLLGLGLSVTRGEKSGAA